MTRDTPTIPQHHVVIDKSTTARINLGILVSILGIAVGGALYLQNIEHAVAMANTTLLEVKQELARQNGSVLRHSETLVRHSSKLQELETRLEKLEGK